MRVPVIMLVGQAGSGKDTAGKMLADKLQGVVVAQADPMKRFAMKVFDFSVDQLWGPSELRNEVDRRYGPVFDERERKTPAWENADWMFMECHKNWVEDVMEGSTSTEKQDALWHLRSWFDMVKKQAKSGPLSPRYVLMTLGTEWGRMVSKNVWVEYAKRTAFKLLGGGFTYTRQNGLIGGVETADPVNAVIVTDGRFRNEIVLIAGAGGLVIKIERPSAAGAEAEAAGIKGHASEKEQRGIPLHFFHAQITNNGTLGALEAMVSGIVEDWFGTDDYTGKL